MGYVNFKGVDCIFTDSEDGITLIPAKNELSENIIRYQFERNFLFEYSHSAYKYIAHIDYIKAGFDNNLVLIPKYLVRRHENEPIKSMEFIGSAIDDFFSPSKYYFTKKRQGQAIGNLVYEKEYADSWDIKFEKLDLKISLSYGEILRNGALSDLMLHPKLKVSFPATNDVSFLYRIYLLITRFLQVIRYDLNYGELKVKLFDTKGLEGGRLIIQSNKYNQHSIPHQTELDYNTFKPFLSKIFQFVADNAVLSLNHLPQETIRFNQDHYDPIVFIALFAAFEYECQAKSEIYANVDSSKIATIKETILQNIDASKNKSYTKEEKQFIEDAKGNIKKLGTSFGQKQKIKNAYTVLSDILQSSIDNIFYLCTFRHKSIIPNSDLNKIAQELTEMRNKIAHGNFSLKFTEEQAQLIRFLEIMVYIQMMKRADIANDDIELMIGVIFCCNFKYNEKFFKK